MTKISEIVEQRTEKIQDLLEQAKDEDDLNELQNIFDEVGTESDKLAEVLGRASDVLNGKDQEQGGAPKEASGKGQSGSDDSETEDEDEQQTKAKSKGSRSK